MAKYCSAVGRTRTLALSILSAVVVAALLPIDAADARPLHTPRYRLVDVGTLGGPNAEVDGPARQITASGAVLGLADTSVPNDDYPNDGFCGDHALIGHAFSWQHGRLTDLGALPGTNCSAVYEVNAHGLGAGWSETGGYDNRTHAPTVHAVLFARGRVTDIGTLPGGSTSFAYAINHRGQILGTSNTADTAGPGLPGFPDWGGQIRSFVWQNGVKRDLGTLGGPGALAETMNERGQVAGESYVDAEVNPDTGFPNLHPFLWQRGRMHDLGSFGGGITQLRGMNQRGDVVGNASLPGEQINHAFLWDGHRLRDLGTLGGDYAEATRINDRGEVAGVSLTAGNTTYHTYLWRRGVTTDLSPGDDQCTFAEWINNRGAIVGARCGERSALLWRHGRQYDLNDFVGPTDVHLTTGTFIDDRGRIVALGTLPNGNHHVFLLEPRE
jgi:probable HAF family extracellular repeat protein